MLEGWGWAVAYRLSFYTMLSEATLAQLPPSMIKEHTFPWTVHLGWKMFSLYSSLSPLILLEALLNTNNWPSSAASTTFSWLFIRYTSQSSSFSSSLLASYSAKEMILLFRHSEAMWPRPWHLKHLLVVGRPWLGLFFGSWLFCGVLFFLWEGSTAGYDFRRVRGAPLFKGLSLR